MPLPTESDNALRLLLISPKPAEAEALRASFTQSGFSVQLDHCQAMQQAPAELALYDLALLDGGSPQSLADLIQLAPDLPVVALHDGPHEHAVHLRWLRDGALECLFAKDTPGLAAVGYRALHARRRAAQRRQQEAPIIDSRELMRAVVRACPYGIVALDPARHVMLWSGAIASITSFVAVFTSPMWGRMKLTTEY